MRILCLTLLIIPFMASTLLVVAQDIEFTATLNKSEVGINEKFQLSYELNSNQGDFKEPEFLDFQIVSGPNRSTSMKFENGVQTSSSAFKYQLKPTASGVYSLPIAKVVVDGKTYKSQKISITVSADEVKNAGPFLISKDDAMVSLELDRTTVGMNEIIIAKYMLYSKLDRINRIDAFDTPTPPNMWVRELSETSVTKSEESKVINGIEYDVFRLKTELWEPLQSGSFEMDPFTLSLHVSQREKVQPGGDVFSRFLANYIDTVLPFTSTPVTINVTKTSNSTGKNGFTELMNTKPKSVDLTVAPKTILAVDMTSSMLCRDLNPNRMTAIKDLMLRLIESENKTDFGLMIYTNTASMVVPNSASKDKLKQFISELALEYSEDGTSQSLAIVEAIQQLKDHSGPRNIVLFTDGQNNTGPLAPITAASAASRHQVKVHAVATGKEGEFECYARIGDSAEYQTRNVDLNDQDLKEIVTETTGRFFKLDDASKMEMIVNGLVKELSVN